MKIYIKSLIGLLFKYLFPVFFRYSNLRIILMYHRVLSDQPEMICERSMYVTKETFQMHINELLSSFNIVSLENLLHSEEKGTRLCSITFDDGWLDNYTHAYPVLIERNVPATIFLPTALINTNETFWFQRLSNAANSAVENDRHEEFISFFAPYCNDNKLHGKITDKYLYALTADLKRKVMAKDLDSICLKAETIFCPHEDEDCTLLNWNQVNEMGKHGIKFGSHSQYHHILTMLNPVDRDCQIVDSLQELKDNTGAFTLYFSYPNGDLDHGSVSSVKGSGYQGAVTTKLGLVTTCSDRYRLNRIPMHDSISCSPALFWFRIFQAIYL